MKVGFDAKRLFRNYTGLGNYSRTLVSNLHRWHGEENSYFLLTEKVTQNDETEEFSTDHYQIITPNKGRRTWRSFGCVKDIARQKIDIYHGLSHDLPFGIKKSGAKSVVTIHDVCYKTFPAMFPLVERLIYSIKYKYSLKNADRVIAISQSTKHDIEKFFPSIEPSKIEVIYQALNSVFYQTVTTKEARRIVSHYGLHGDFILYVGSINERKNLLGVLHSYAKIPSVERLTLVVIGNGSGQYAKKCNAVIEELGLEDDVVRIENLSSMGALRSFYTLAKFMVYPSFYEGFGLPVAEAQLCGCPAITSCVSSLPEAGGPYALYVDPQNEAQLSEAMYKLLKFSREERDELGEKGRAWVYETFDAQKLTAQVAALYHSL